VAPYRDWLGFDISREGTDIFIAKVALRVSLENLALVSLRSSTAARLVPAKLPVPATPWIETSLIFGSMIAWKGKKPAPHYFGFDVYTPIAIIHPLKEYFLRVVNKLTNGVLSERRMLKGIPPRLLGPKTALASTKKPWSYSLIDYVIITLIHHILACILELAIFLIFPVS